MSTYPVEFVLFKLSLKIIHKYARGRLPGGFWDASGNELIVNALCCNLKPRVGSPNLQACPLSLLLLSVSLLAQEPALDLMLLLESTPGMAPNFRTIRLNSLRAQDRGCVMTFSTKARLRQTCSDVQQA